jgi:PGF-CTERM protein
MRYRTPTFLVLILVALSVVGLTGAGAVAVPAPTVGGGHGVTPDASVQPVNSTVGTVNGQIALEDTRVEFRGTARGTRELAYIMIGANGVTVAQTGVTDANGTFNRNVPLQGRNRPLTAGNVIAFVITPGRDGAYGRSDQFPNTSNELVQFVVDLGEQGLSQDAIVRRILEATVDASGSDDLADRTNFVLTRATITIDEVNLPDGQNVSTFQPGETMVVRGTTNRRPDQNSLNVEVGSGPSAGAFAGDIVDRWGSNGTWTARIDVPEDAATGTYTLRAADGDSTDTTTFAVASERQNVTPTTAIPGENVTTTTTTTPGDDAGDGDGDGTPNATTETETTTTTETTALQPTTTTETETETTALQPTTTTEQPPNGTEPPATPGFGVLVAVVALAAVVLLRRARDG